MSAQRNQGSPPATERGVSLPARVVVSLRAGVILAVANVACVVILSWAWMHVRAEPKAIAVTGSAKKRIESDLIVWRGEITVNHQDMVTGFDTLKAASEKTLAYLKKEGVGDQEITVSSIATRKHFVRDEKGHDTDKISSYELGQTIEVSSANVPLVAAVARKVTDLIKEGVLLESQPPKYLYTKLADLKVAMLAEATRDATARAEQIASNSGARLGPIREARMGVMQITAVHSNEVSDQGLSDTSSFEKEITAVVSTRFSLE